MQSDRSVLWKILVFMVTINSLSNISWKYSFVGSSSFSRALWPHMWTVQLVLYVKWLLPSLCISPAAIVRPFMSMCMRESQTSHLQYNYGWKHCNFQNLYFKNCKNYIFMCEFSHMACYSRAESTAARMSYLSHVSCSTQQRPPFHKMTQKFLVSGTNRF